MPSGQFGGISVNSQEVLGFQLRIISKDLFGYAMAADAGFPKAHIRIKRDPLKKRVMNRRHFVVAPAVIV